jgi:hypothetical protein
MLKTDECGGVFAGGRSTHAPYEFSTRPILRDREKLRDEFSSRRSSFREGSPIQLSDGQTWILASPPKKSERNKSPFKSGYTDIIQALIEAEDCCEQCLGELALAILLLEHNYYLSPADYQRLLAPGTSDWQWAFHEIVQNHIRVFVDTFSRQFENRPFASRQRGSDQARSSGSRA